MSLQETTSSQFRDRGTLWTDGGIKGKASKMRIRISQELYRCARKVPYSGTEQTGANLAFIIGSGATTCDVRFRSVVGNGKDRSPEMPE